ncbi:MAG TPA: T9SS type A sorting domain-containing protein, partial [Ignavibacteriaceae bacterium]|nr:T9SS type A sorting domain-containing protein [Ignavibacteriaceae bacterium]
LNCKFPGGSPRIVGNVFVSNPLNCSAMKYNAPNDVTSDLYKEEKLENTEAEESKSPEEDYKSISKIYFDLLQKIDSDLSAIGYFDKNKFYGEYINVIDNFKGFINKYPSSFLSATAITTIFHSFKQLEEYEAMKTFLDGIINDNKLSKFSSLAKRFIIDYYSIRKNYISAVTTADEILNITSVDTNLICDVLYQKGLIYSHDMNNTTAAVESFSKIIKNYPDNLLVYFAKNELSILGYNLEESQEKSQVAEPLKFTMSNYPNPFNPVTTINYSLPNNEKVVIKVYDILGREIAELVNEVKTAGRYSVKFDGAELSSGIYFYSITAGDYRQVKKIVLTK